MKIDFTKHIKPLSRKSDKPIWKRKIRNLFDYQEGVVDDIEGKQMEPELLGV